MAYDPNMSYEEKKRRSFARQALSAPSPSLAREGRQFADDFRAGGLAQALRNNASAGLDIVHEAGAAAAHGFNTFADGQDTADQWADQNDQSYYGGPKADFSNVTQAPERAPLNIIDPQSLEADAVKGYRKDLAGAGLTRIVKNPDGSYTNMPQHEQAGGEARYYNQYGNREGVSGKGATVAEYNASERASAKNLDTDDAAFLRAVEGTRGADGVARGGGIQSKQFAAGAGLRRAALEEQATLDKMPPAQRALLMNETTKQTNANARTQATLQNARDIAAGSQRLTRETLDLDRDKFDDARDQAQLAEERKNPTGALREQLNELSNMSPKEKASILSDPTDKRGARARGLFQQIFDNAGGGGASVSGITKASGLRRFLHSPLSGGLTAPKYDANNGLIYDDLFDPSDIGNFSQEDIDALISSGVLADSGQNR